MKKKVAKPKYLACIWCGGNIPVNKPYAQYCSIKCKEEALGQVREPMEIIKELEKLDRQGRKLLNKIKAIC